MEIGGIISKAIKESKWLNISYINKNGENTFYWIAINDIDFERKTLFVSPPGSVQNRFAEMPPSPAAQAQAAQAKGSRKTIRALPFRSS
ncbi:MAG: hypothetical protein J5697_01990 [Clostridia bacterium]|nr:hypothetical protein [Clostridia bacterium]